MEWEFLLLLLVILLVLLLCPLFVEYGDEWRWVCCCRWSSNFDVDTWGCGSTEEGTACWLGDGGTSACESWDWVLVIFCCGIDVDILLLLSLWMLIWLSTKSTNSSLLESAFVAVSSGTSNGGSGVTISVVDALLGFDVREARLCRPNESKLRRSTGDFGLSIVKIKKKDRKKR